MMMQGKRVVGYGWKAGRFENTMQKHAQRAVVSAGRDALHNTEQKTMTQPASFADSKVKRSVRRAKDIIGAKTDVKAAVESIPMPAATGSGVLTPMDAIRTPRFLGKSKQSRNNIRLNL